VFFLLLCFLCFRCYCMCLLMCVCRILIKITYLLKWTFWNSQNMSSVCQFQPDNVVYEMYTLLLHFPWNIFIFHFVFSADLQDILFQHFHAPFTCLVICLTYPQLFSSSLMNTASSVKSGLLLYHHCVMLVCLSVCVVKWTATTLLYKDKAEHLYSALHGIQTTLKRSGMDHAVYLQ